MTRMLIEMLSGRKVEEKMLFGILNPAVEY